MKNISIKLCAFLFILALSACGGGGGSTPNTTSYSLSQVKSLSQGFSASFPSMTGSDNTGASYTASLMLSNLPLTTYNSQTVTPRQSVVSITNVTSGAFVTGTGTSYIAAGFVLVGSEDSSGVVCAPTSQTAPPDSVTIGNSGSLASLTCSDGSTSTMTWRVDAASGGQAKFTVIESSFNGGTLDHSEEDRYIIDTAGDIKGVEVSLYFASTGITLNLAGNRQ